MNAPTKTAPILTLSVRVPSAIGIIVGHEPMERTLAVPSAGITFTSSKTQGGSLFWVDGLAAQAARRDSFFENIRAGRVPTLAVGHPLLTAPISVRTVNTEQTLDSGTLAHALGITELIADLFAHAPSRRCATCNTTIELFHSPDDLASSVVRGREGQPLELFVSADHEPLIEWGAANGFDIEAAPTDGIRVESLIIAASARTRLLPVLRSAWRLPNFILTATTDVQKERLSPGGTCSTCGSTHAPVCRASLVQFARSGKDTLGAADLECDSLTLREVLSLPVEDLAAAQSLLGTSIERHLNLLCRVELGRYSLGVDISNVPVTAVVQATVASALSKSEEGQLLIIDTPLSALPDAQRSSLISLIEQHAVTASIVVISGDDADATAPAVKQSSSASNTPWITVPHPDTRKPLDVGPGLRLTVTRRASEPARWLAGVQRQLDEAPSLGSLQPRAFTPTFVPLFPRHEMRRLTLAEELEIYERLSRLFASSQDAKMLGLAPASFRLGSHSNKKLVCPVCRGLGLELTRAPGFTRPVPAPCSGCRGARFTRALREITFRGSRMSDLLNRPLKESAHTLKVLPKAGRMLELLTALGLDHLPLGFPIALLSPAEFRLVCIAKAVASARSERPALLLLEHPWAGFSAEQRQRLVAVLETEPATNLSWILEL